MRTVSSYGVEITKTEYPGPSDNGDLSFRQSVT